MAGEIRFTTINMDAGEQTLYNLLLAIQKIPLGSAAIILFHGTISNSEGVTWGSTSGGFCVACRKSTAWGIRILFHTGDSVSVNNYTNISVGNSVSSNTISWTVV